MRPGSHPPLSSQERRRALALLRPHRGAFLRASLLGAATVGAQALLVIALGTFFSSLSAGRPPAGVLLEWKGGGLLGFSLGCLALLRYRQPLAQAAAERAFITDAQERILLALLARPGSFWAGRSPGDLALRLTSDLQELLAYVKGWYQASWLLPLRALALSAVFYWLSPALALWGIAFLLAAAAVLTLLGKRFSALAVEEREARTAQAAFLAGVLSGAEILSAFDARRKVVEELSARTSRVFEKGTRLSVLSGWSSQLAEFLRLGSAVCLLLWGQTLVARQELSLDRLLAAVPVMFLLFGALLEIARQFPRLAGGGAAARAILSLLETAPAALAMPPEKIPEKIEFKGIRFAYPEGPEIFEGASFEIRRGDWTALVGPSGSGKSTLLKLLLGLETPRAGEILANGRDITGDAAQALRPLCAIATQEPLLPYRGFRENLLLARPGAKDRELWDVLDAVGLAERVRQWPRGLDSDLGERGGALSGGEKERLSLARALLSPAPILLLDEPTAFLDAATQGRILGRLDAERTGRTIVIATHDPSLLSRADRVYEIRERKIVDGAAGPGPTLRARSARGG